MENKNIKKSIKKCTMLSIVSLISFVLIGLVLFYVSAMSVGALLIYAIGYILGCVQEKYTILCGIFEAINSRKEKDKLKEI